MHVQVNVQVTAPYSFTFVKISVLPVIFAPMLVVQRTYVRISARDIFLPTPASIDAMIVASVLTTNVQRLFVLKSARDTGMVL
jgi:hypothetical protein